MANMVPQHYCAKNQCPHLVDRGVRLCPDHAAQAGRSYNKQRDPKVFKLYGDQWRKLRRMHLRRNPLCIDCLSDGITKEGQEVHHIIDHKGNRTLFFDPDNLATLCKSHHSQKTVKSWTK